jgi:two pore calcium channel protein 1
MQRLFKLKRRFRDIFGTIIILISRLVSLAIAMILLYYFFAIIGMEIFGSYTGQMKNCCQNTSVEQYYLYNNETGLYGFYYLNTFENILVSGVTLFELTVVNNWHIIMEGYAHVVSDWSRIYFMSFYLIVMMVMAIIVTLVLDAFKFRIQCRETMECEDVNNRAIHKEVVSLSVTEVEMCEGGNVGDLTGRHIVQQAQAGASDGSIQQQDCNDSSCSSLPNADHLVSFCGTRILSKVDFSLKMYMSEDDKWIAESDTAVDAAVAMPTEVISGEGSKS